MLRLIEKVIIICGRVRAQQTCLMIAIFVASSSCQPLNGTNEARFATLKLYRLALLPLLLSRLSSEILYLSFWSNILLTTATTKPQKLPLKQQQIG